MYGALTVAKYIIYHCNRESLLISNLRLQKVLYFVQADYLVNTDNPCFPDEIEAWDFGPVVPIVYHTYKIFGGNSIVQIDKHIKEFILADDQIRINATVSACAKYTVSQLVFITHHQTPWLQAYSQNGENIITKKSIEEFFKQN